MKDNEVKSVFMTGTGTDVGKTYISGLILKKLNDNNINSAYYKAAMSGNEQGDDGILIPGDAVNVKELSGITQNIEGMCPYIYETAVSPHLASRLEGNPVDLKNVIKGYEKLCKEHKYILVEGSGGIMCPIHFEENENKNRENNNKGKLWLEDIIRELQLPSIIVADAGLGTINNVGLTAFYMKQKNLKAKGIIFNNYEPSNTMHNDNLKMCEYITGLDVIACIKKDDTDIDISLSELKKIFE